MTPFRLMATAPFLHDENAPAQARLFASFTNLLVALVGLLIACAPFYLRQGCAAGSKVVHLLTGISFNPFISTALGAGAILYLLVHRRSHRELTLVLMLTSLLAAVYGVAGVGAAFWVGAPFLMGGGVLGIACIGTCLLVRDTRSLILTAAFPVCMTITAVFLGAMVRFHPTTFDPTLFRFDQSLGGQISFWMGRLLAASTPLRNTAFLAYIMLPVAPAFAYLFERRLRVDGVLVQFLILGAVGSIAINLLPAAGPKFAFAAFPVFPALGDLPSAARMMLPLAPRNAIPSLHMSWALLLFWHSRPYPRWARSVFALLVALTVMATLGLGEHYVVDLVVAFPFTLALRSAFARKAAATVVCVSTVAAWLILLGTGALTNYPSLVLSWMLVIGTVGGSCWAEHRLFCIPANTANEDPCHQQLTDDEPSYAGVAAA